MTSSVPRVQLFSDSRMLDHVAPYRHPERPERLLSVLRHLERTGLDAACAPGIVREATEEELRRVHSKSYLRYLEEYANRGGGRIEADTWVGPGSLTASRLAAGSAIEAVRAVFESEQRIAFCATRPPGHHARPDQAMGFCHYANAALGAAEALEAKELNRVLIVDWDVHHGNGTQEIFYEDPRVGFLSIHRHPFYPGTGMADETGTGPGLGTTLNLPTKEGTSRREICQSFITALESISDQMRPELVILSAGFDAHRDDPVGDLGLEIEDFEVMGQAVLEVAENHASGRLVSILEGGYNTGILAGCVESHLTTLGVQKENKRNI